MTHSSYDSLEINMLEADLTYTSGFDEMEVSPDFMASLWYKDIIDVL